MTPARNVHGKKNPYPLQNFMIVMVWALYFLPHYPPPFVPLSLLSVPMMLARVLHMQSQFYLMLTETGFTYKQPPLPTLQGHPHSGLSQPMTLIPFTGTLNNNAHCIPYNTTKRFTLKTRPYLLLETLNSDQTVLNIISLIVYNILLSSLLNMSCLSFFTHLIENYC